jgi:hypothetical protein
LTARALVGRLGPVEGAADVEVGMIRSNKNRQPRHRPSEVRPSEPDAAERRHLDELLDEGLKETFPASDPVAVVQKPPEWVVVKRPRRTAHARARYTQDLHRSGVFGS